jgi:hypothetical protein
MLKQSLMASAAFAAMVGSQGFRNCGEIAIKAYGDRPNGSSGSPHRNDPKQPVSIGRQSDVTMLYGMPNSDAFRV